MLNVFPNLLTYTMLAPLILRVFLAVYLIWRSSKDLKNPTLNSLSKFSAVVLIIAGAALFVGILTQLAAIVVIVCTLIPLLYNFSRKTLDEKDIIIQKLILVIAVSLLFTGAGAAAFDLPL